MGHAMTVGIVNQKSEIMTFAREFSFYNTDRWENPSGSYHNNLTIVENIVMDSFEEAEEYLLNRFQGYHDGAIQFRDVESIEVPKSIENKEEQLKKLQSELEKLEYKNHFSNHSAKFISCPHCESKINSGFIKQRNAPYLVNKCPVCNKDMRPQSALDRVQGKEDKIKELRTQINDMKKEFQKKAKNKAKIKWAVKVEVHT